jgi:hypothetical protein
MQEWRCRDVDAERWDLFEESFSSGRRYGNPFVEVRLHGTFTHEEGDRITVDGFHDGEATWRLRFMPVKLGRWTWQTASSDPDLNDRGGEIRCVEPRKAFLRGPLRTEGLHFRHADGSRRYLISTRLSCQFDDPRNWVALVDYLKTNRINRVFFVLGGNTSQSMLNRASDPRAGHGKVLFGRDFDDQDAWRFHVDAWRRIDRFIETLRVNDIVASPYFYYFNDGFQKTMTSDQDDLFIRYGMARFGSFCNVVPVLGNQIEHHSQERIGVGYDVDLSWQNEKGRLLKHCAVYGQAVSVHNPCEGPAVRPSFWTALFNNPFPFADFLLKQSQVPAMGDAARLDDDTPEKQDDDGDGKPDLSVEKDFTERAFARHNDFCIQMRKRWGIPIISEEPAYDFEVDEGLTWYAQNHNTMRATFWTAAMGGGYAAWGSKATYANGADRAYPQMAGNLEMHTWARDWGADPLSAMKLTPTAAYLRVLHDFMISLPYWEMEPDNDIVGGPTASVEGEEYRTTFCLKKDGEQYVVYALVGGRVTIAVPQGAWRLRRLDPRDGSVMELGTKPGGTLELHLPESRPSHYWRHTGDWVVLVRRD